MDKQTNRQDLRLRVGGNTHVQFVGTQCHQPGTASSMENGSVQMLQDRYQKKSGWLKEGVERVINILYSEQFFSSNISPIHVQNLNFPPEFAL